MSARHMRHGAYMLCTVCSRHPMALHGAVSVECSMYSMTAAAGVIIGSLENTMAPLSLCINSEPNSALPAWLVQLYKKLAICRAVHCWGGEGDGVIQK